MPRPLKRLVIRATSESFTVGVVALVTNERGEVLVLRHSYRPRGPWGFPAGQVKRGERFDTGLRREFREETGWTLGPLRAVAVTHWIDPPEVHVLYRTSIAGGTFRPSPEVLDYRFIAPADLEGFVGRPYRPGARLIRRVLAGEPRAGP